MNLPNPSLGLVSKCLAHAQRRFHTHTRMCQKGKALGAHAQRYWEQRRVLAKPGRAPLFFLATYSSLASTHIRHPPSSPRAVLGTAEPHLGSALTGLDLNSASDQSEIGCLWTNRAPSRFPCSHSQLARGPKRLGEKRKTRRGNDAKEQDDVTNRLTQA